MKPNDYERIEKAIRTLETAWPHQPNLKELARQMGLSPFHFQRLFKRWAGVSPKRFLQYLTAEHAKKCLRASKSVLDAALDSGLSGPGRLHDLFLSVEAMTPGEYKANGAGLTIGWGAHETPFGKALVASTSRGICGLVFVDGSEKKALAELKKKWPKSRFVENREKTSRMAKSLFDGPGPRQVKVLLKGTPFQIKVWEALLRIPSGKVRAYQDVARNIGKPRASRAVGTAIGQNTVAYLIPCHRVIRDTGVIGNYKWGSTRKKAILAWEASQV